MGSLIKWVGDSPSIQILEIALLNWQYSTFLILVKHNDLASWFCSDIAKMKQNYLKFIYFSPRLQLQYNSFSCCTYKEHVRTKINWFWQWHKNIQKMSDIWLQYLHHWKVWQLLQDSSHLRSNKIWQHGIFISDQFCKIFCDTILKISILPHLLIQLWDFVRYYYS